MGTMSSDYTWVLVTMIMTCVLYVYGENLAFVSSDTNTIFKATLPETVGDALVFTNVIDLDGPEVPQQLGYDPVYKMIYWADFSSTAAKISKCDLNGNNRKDFDISEEAAGLALDVVNRRLYYTSPEYDVGIYTLDMDLNGPVKRLITSTPIDESYYYPWYVAYGSESKRLYYTLEWYYTHGVESCNVDGTDRNTLVVEDAYFLYYPKQIFLEEKEQMLYYVAEEYGAIHRLNYGHSNLTKNVVYAGGNVPQGLTLYKDDIYWCDYDSDAGVWRVHRIAKDGVDIYSPITVPATFDGGALDKCRNIYFYIEVPCVSNLVVTSDSSSQLSVTWDVPSALCLADEFRVKYQPINVDQCESEVGFTTTLEWQTQTFVTLVDLKPYTTYRVDVTPGLIKSSSTEEGVSMEGTQVTGEEAPSQSPPGVQYEITDTSVIFTWLEIPCGSRRGLLDHYEYKMSSNGVILASWTDTAREIAVDRPPCGTVTFQVAGVNSAGMMSDYNTLSFEVISPDPFLSNTGLQISGITETTAAITWSKTECPPSDYAVQYMPVKLGQCPRNIETNDVSIGKDQEASVTLDSLEPGSEYEVIVSAMNQDGDQRQLHDYFVTPEAVPSDRPQNLQITYGIGGSAQITWDEIPCESRGGSSFYYSFSVLVDGVEWRSGKTSDAYFTELRSPFHSSGQVEFVVAGATEAGTGTSSSVYYDVNLAGLCPQSCGSHGNCDYLENTCRCDPGYTGESCETSLCIAACENGGECTQKGICLCPQGFTGLQCQSAQLESNGLPTSTVEGQFSVISCDGVPAVFTADLNVEGETAREEMLRKIQPLLNEFLGAIAGVISVGNLRFSPGSIVVSFTVTADSGTTASDIDNGINNLVQSAPALSGLTIDPSSAKTFTDDLATRCPQDYCRNGGTCTVGVSSLEMTCTCANGYDGLQCEEKESNLSGGEILGIMAGVFGIIIAAMLIVMCFCMYTKSKAQAAKDRQLQPNINTLDLATSPYTYPRNNLNTFMYN